MTTPSTQDFINLQTFLDRALKTVQTTLEHHRSMNVVEYLDKEFKSIEKDLGLSEFEMAELVMIFHSHVGDLSPSEVMAIQSIEVIQKQPA